MARIWRVCGGKVWRKTPGKTQWYVNREVNWAYTVTEGRQVDRTVQLF